MLETIRPPLFFRFKSVCRQDYGLEDAIDPHDKPWKTGFFKTPIEGPVFVGTMNLAGDGQADLKNHGGVDKAVLAYSADHYPKWRRRIAHARHAIRRVRRKPHHRRPEEAIGLYWRHLSHWNGDSSK